MDKVIDALMLKSRTDFLWKYRPDGLDEIGVKYTGDEFVGCVRKYLASDFTRTKLTDFICENERLSFSESELSEIAELPWSSEAGRSLRSLRSSNGKGLTLRLREGHLHDKNLGSILEMFKPYLSEPMGLNVYYTTANSGVCIPAHRDAGDIFVLQVAGEKKWMLEPNLSEHDLLDNPEGNGVLTESFVLGAGGLLFIPQQLAHRTETLPNEHSLHITIQGNSNLGMWINQAVRYWFHGSSALCSEV